MNRKLLLLTLLVCMASSAFASSLIQGNWRWRNDNGDENTATFKANQNTAIAINDLSVIRLRVRVENSSSDAGETHAVGALKYSTSTSGPFVNVGGGSNPAFIYVQSPTAPAAKTLTTNATFLTTINAANITPYNYVSGQYFTAERVLTDNDDKAKIPPSTYADMEFVIKPTTNALPSTTYYFVAENTKSNNDVPTNENNFAVLMTGAVLPVDFVSFEAKAEQDKVRLKWSTASEKNNERFEVSRSADAKSWQLVNAQNGKGNSEVHSSYHSVDYRPLNGISYYQLAQFDFDGTKKVLAIQSVNLSLAPSVDVNVFPNPAVKDINVSINNYAGKNAEASLYAQDGRLVHKEQLKNEATSQKLNINKMPVSGVYILKIVGDGLSASKKVVIL